MRVSRRRFLSLSAGSLAALKFGGLAEASASAPEIAITMDDPKPDALAGVPGAEINRRILDTLAGARVKAVLFVTGMRVDNAAGKALVGEWDERGHLIGNHSYSHRNYNSAEITYEAFSADVLKNEPVIRGYRHFVRLFRYPVLKEGDSAEKRDRFRALLRQHGYRVGHVTVDASDWYIDQRLRARLEKGPKAKTEGYRDYYVAHIRDRPATTAGWHGMFSATTFAIPCSSTTTCSTRFTSAT